LEELWEICLDNFNLYFELIATQEFCPMELSLE